MELNPQKLQALRALSESQLATMIQSTALSLGLGERKARLFASQSGKLKKKLQTMSDEQLIKLASMLGEEQLKSLLSSMP